MPRKPFKLRKGAEELGAHVERQMNGFFSKEDLVIAERRRRAGRDFVAKVVGRNGEMPVNEFKGWVAGTSWPKILDVDVDVILEALEKLRIVSIENDVIRIHGDHLE